MNKKLAAGFASFLCTGLAACGDSSPTSAAPLTYKSVPRALCGAGDQPETDLQGRVPLADRDSGRSLQPYNCNLDLLGQYQGQGASWQFAWFEDCGYYGTANTDTQTQKGVVVIDASNPAKPVPSDYLDSVSMLDPWESLKVDQERKLLAAVRANGGSGGPEIDVYDLSEDCKHPKLLASTAPVANALGQTSSQVGHAGAFAPGGMTYYGTTTLQKLTAIDLTDPAQPKFLAETNAAIHDLSVSVDGTRAYIAQLGPGNAPTAPGVPSATPPNNGLVILDTSMVASRAASPVIRPVSAVYWQDGAVAQTTQVVKIGGKPYVIFTDEQGPSGLFALVGGVNGLRASCDQGLPPWGMARIIDISNELLPTVVSKLMLEVNDPQYCEMTIHDVTGTGIFGYDSHYCNVDDTENATALACGHFQAGIRVFDIRDPVNPKEIAYYRPGGQVSKQDTLASSNHAATDQGGSLTADWCSAQVRFIKETGQLWTTCQDNGFLALKFTNCTWPFDQVCTPVPVVTPAPLGPVSHSKFGGALGFGLLLPLGIFVLRRRSKTKVQYRDEDC